MNYYSNTKPQLIHTNLRNSYNEIISKPTNNNVINDNITNTTIYMFNEYVKPNIILFIIIAIMGFILYQRYVNTLQLRNKYNANNNSNNKGMSLTDMFNYITIPDYDKHSNNNTNDVQSKKQLDIQLNKFKQQLQQQMQLQMQQQVNTQVQYYINQYVQQQQQQEQLRIQQMEQQKQQQMNMQQNNPYNNAHNMFNNPIMQNKDSNLNNVNYDEILSSLNNQLNSSYNNVNEPFVDPPYSA